MTVDGYKTAFPMPGVTVHAPATDKVYVSMVAIAMIDAFKGAGKSFAGSKRAIVEERLREIAAAEGVDPDFAVSLLD
jgi:hypothetical protein